MPISSSLYTFNRSCVVNFYLLISISIDQILPSKCICTVWHHEWHHVLFLVRTSLGQNAWDLKTESWNRNGEERCRTRVVPTDLSRDTQINLQPFRIGLLSRTPRSIHRLVQPSVLLVTIRIPECGGSGNLPITNFTTGHSQRAIARWRKTMFIEKVSVGDDDWSLPCVLPAIDPISVKSKHRWSKCDMCFNRVRIFVYLII